MEKKEQDKSFSPNANLWLDVKRDIEAKIITGKYAAGYKIPTIMELAEQYNIGKTTAQKVIGGLFDDGTIIKKVGMGCFVKPFIKEKLLALHKKELKAHMISVIEEACLLGLDRDYIVRLTEEAWKEVNCAEKEPSV